MKNRRKNRSSRIDSGKGINESQVDCEKKIHCLSVNKYW